MNKQHIENKEHSYSGTKDESKILGKVTFFYGIIFISVGFGVILQKLILLDDIFYLAFIGLGLALITLSAMIKKNETTKHDG